MTNRVNKNELSMGKPWLSIVIPVYNAEKYLAECLNRICKQTFTDFEVILVDDGSTDKSSEICLKYEHMDHRFHYIYKDNGGSYQTRIFGAEMAAGEYITFCDADDYYTGENAFQRVYEEITQHGSLALQFGYLAKYNHIKRKCYSVKEPIDVSWNEFYEKEYPKLLCSNWKSSHLNQTVWNKVYHKTLIQNLPDSNSAKRIFWGDDLILNLHLLSSCKKMRFIPDTLYCYRQGSGLTKKYSSRTMNDLDTIKGYQLSFCKEYNSSLKEMILRNLHAETAGWLYYYIRESLDHIDENEIKNLINHSLQLPNIQQARKYFTEENKENWDGVYLLKKGSAEEYLQKAKEYKRNETGNLKRKIKGLIKKIYTSI